MQTKKFSYLLIAAVIMAGSWGHSLWVKGAMTSSNYTIYADSIGFGGAVSTGTDITLTDTIGESPTGFSTSSSYEVRGGFQHMQRDDLSITVSATSLDLGTLSDNTIKSGSTIVTVTSYALSGYTLSVGAVSGTMLAAVTDGSVTSGSEEYGFSASGSDVAFNGDVAVVVGRVIASSNAPAYTVPTTLTFKAAQSLSTTAGTYSQSVSLAASANF